MARNSLNRSNHCHWPLIAVCLMALAACPAFAANIPAGSDMFITPGLIGPFPSATYDDLSIPAGFFGPGSDPFTGRVYFRGVPLTGTNTNGADTIVRRNAAATLPIPGSQDTVPIEIIALSLVSCQPITVTFGGPSSQYDVRVCLGNTPQPIGSMTIRLDNANGGTFDSTLPVIPRLTFTRVSGTQGNPSVALDPAPQVIFNTVNARWAHSASPLLGILSSPGGSAIQNCDPTPRTFPANNNFIVGVNSNNPTTKCMTHEQALLAAHGVLPNETPAKDSDSDGVPDHGDNCPDNFNPAQEDDDNDCIGNPCDNLTMGVPAASSWGMAVVGVIVLLGGVMLLKRSSRAAA